MRYSFLLSLVLLLGIVTNHQTTQPEHTLFVIGDSTVKAKPVVKSPIPTIQAIKLWPNGAPGALGSDPDDIPTLTPFIPRDKVNGSAVIVCPGGGYQHLAD